MIETVYNHLFEFASGSLIKEIRMEKLQNAKDLRSGKINKIEALKETNSPLEFFQNLSTICEAGLENLTDTHKEFLLKCFGIFHKEEGLFMLRLRIPAGQLEPYQALAIGGISKEFGNNYIDITTRQQIELRYLKLEDLPKIINKLKAVGISTFQTGIDNFRNIITSSFDGLGGFNIINCTGLVHEMQEIFFKKEEWLGTLPRKFNTGILGTTINDCNIYGQDCSFVVAKREDVFGFHLLLGGKVGVQATDCGIFIEEKDVITVYKAVIHLFKEFGFRDNRNKNRLHFLLVAVGIEEFAKAIKTYTNIDFREGGEILATHELQIENDCLVEIDDTFTAYGVTIPSGILSGSDMMDVAKLAMECDGKIRLTVEQSLYLVCENSFIQTIHNSNLAKKYSKYQNIFFRNMIACAGTKTCSFGVIDSKSLAIDMANFLQNEFPQMEGKIRFYWSGCPKGCGIHGVGDIGFEGCKTKDEAGNRCDGLHIFVGGKATKETGEAKILHKALPFEVAKEKVKELVLDYQNDKLENESFEAFHSRVTCIYTI